LQLLTSDGAISHCISNTKCAPMTENLLSLDYKCKMYSKINGNCIQHYNTQLRNELY